MAGSEEGVAAGPVLAGVGSGGGELLARGVAWLQELARHLDADATRLAELESRVRLLEASQRQLVARLDAAEEAQRQLLHGKAMDRLESRLAALERRGMYVGSPGGSSDLVTRITQLESTLSKALGGDVKSD